MKKIKRILHIISNAIDKFLEIKYVRCTLLIICGCVFVFSAYQIGRWAYDNYRTNKAKSALSKIANATENNEANLFDYPLTSDPNGSKPVDINKIKFLTTNIVELKKLNSDTVGWIKMLSNNVDYPIVQTTDNEYYLTNDFNKTGNSAGWIFGDYRCDFNNIGNHTIIYGHARADYSMFGGLGYTVHEWWYKRPENHFIWINTENKKMVWQIFSIYEVDPNAFYYIKTDFNSSDEYANFLTEIKAKNQVPTLTYDVIPQDKLLTLSTCRGSKNRLVVHAKLVKSERLKPPTSSNSSGVSSNILSSTLSSSSSSSSESSKIQTSSTISSIAVASSSDTSSTTESSQDILSSDSPSSEASSSDISSEPVRSQEPSSADASSP